MGDRITSPKEFSGSKAIRATAPVGFKEKLIRGIRLRRPRIDPIHYSTLCE